MNYPFTDADWFAKDLPKTTLYRRVSVGLLTLGHLRTAEAIGVCLLTGGEVSAMDWGLLLTIAQMDWRKARKRAAKPSLFWALRRDRNTPRNEEEWMACLKWWRAQNYFPARTLVSSDEADSMAEFSQLAKNRAATPIERLAMSVTRVHGWQTLSGAASVWDIPMATATHILISNNELDGAFYVPYDLVRMAKNGKN